MFSDHLKMAKIAVTFTVIFFLFAFCYARNPSDPTENDVTIAELKTTFTFSQPDTERTRITILLPSEKPESEPHTVAELEPKKTDSKLPESDSTESDTDSVPLTMVSFRPINHHFPRHRFPLTFRRGHRCRHHQDQQRHHIHEFKPWGPRFPHREVPYGDDMIVSDEKDSGSDHPVYRGGVRQIPARWAKFGHEGPGFHHGHDDVEGREHMKKKKRYHRHVEREETEGEHDHEGGFMKKFRKFLIQF